ncbi:sigma-70 family RNA polymerase sigma factor [Rivularia sp. PCC 7116]|uniref:sigma-70 family RNA polymerase sigma factor n=1 Tax=Rivularia sp. PCC 7116 TaxID=373994 RepID=UPI001E3D2CBD|nr:sigma-70 family RNA polymerase sigma factor [Rivularia sp. PCC 7116]
MFSTFAQVEKDTFSKWCVDKKLHRSMQNCFRSLPEESKKENFWALYWHKHWSSQSTSKSLANMHLLAYLQEPCYMVSRKTAASLNNSQYSIADYFQMANAEVETVLKYFNSKKSSSLKAYAMMAIKSQLRDILRQRKEAYSCTNWALLRKVSKKLFLEALENAGLSSLQISQYRLAWTGFKELYVQNHPGSTKSLPQPTSQLWEAIANFYNKYKHQLTQASSSCRAQTVEEWLNQSAIYVRAYLFPSVKSLNTFRANSDSDQSLDLADPSSDSTIADMIATEDLQEQKQQISQIFGVLSQALESLDAKSKQVLQLYYQQGMTQQQIMQQLDMSQPTVSRKLVKSRESLMAALIKWSVDLNISVNANQIKDMSIALEEWLRNQFGDFNMNP